MMFFYFVLHVFGQKWPKLFLRYSNKAQSEITTQAGAESSTMKSIVKECWNISY